MSLNEIRVGLLILICASPVPAAEADVTLTTRSAIYAEWREQCEQYLRETTYAKGFPEERVKILRNLLKKASPGVVTSELLRLEKSAVIVPYPRAGISPFNEGAFDMDFLRANILRFLYETNRSAVVRLLAANCPLYIGTVPLEYRVVVETKNFETVTVLCDAYEKARNTTAKTNVLECLSRSFVSIRKKTPDDVQFVTSCREWILSSKNDIEVNPDYFDPMRPGREPVDLFLLKNKP